MTRRAASQPTSGSGHECFLAKYRAALADGMLADPEQERVALQLDRFGEEFVRRASGQSSTGGIRFWERWHRPRPAPKGLFLWGGVGRGKTALMDMFFRWLPTENKKRFHFHVFMQQVHRHLTALQGEPDPLKLVARRLAEEASVIGLDEFYVEDIGDAMVLAELLEGLFNRGVAFFATSNTAPEALYENGLQRSRFLPAIDLIQSNMEVMEIGGRLDYRLGRLRGVGLYEVVDAQEDFNAREKFALLAQEQPDLDYPLVINDRLLVARFHVEGTAGFDFDSLCSSPRSVADYIELGRLYHTIVIYGLGAMGSEHESQARRFIALIDEFYERNVNLQFFASCSFNDLYSGTRYAAEFERTRSRMIEMQSPEYLARAHLRQN